MTGVLAALLAALTLLLAVPHRPRRRAAHLAAEGRLRPVAGAAPPPQTAPHRQRLPALLAVAPGAVVALTAWTGGPLLAVAVAALCALAVVIARDVIGRRRAAARNAAVATAVRILVGELEAGARPSDALEAAGTAAPILAGVLDRAARAAGAGQDAGAVLAEHADPALRSVGVAWRLSTTTGAALGSVLRRIGTDLAAAEAQRRTVATVLAGPRSSAVVLAGLPALGVALGAGMGADPLDFLLTVPAGRLLCCVGVILDVTGIWWMRALLRRAERS
jgi:tight adherence protein B